MAQNERETVHRDFPALPRLQEILPPSPLDFVRFLPLYGVCTDPDGKARCPCANTRCRDIGKHPVTYDRSARLGEPAGIRTGAGLVVLDVDLKPHLGRTIEEAVTAVEGLLGTLPETYTVLTGGGGLHFYFSTPHACRNAVNLFGKEGPQAGIDVRGEGGYVVAPGMPHASGGVYTVLLDVPLAEAPETLLALVRKKELGPGEIGGELSEPRLPHAPGSPIARAALAKLQTYLRDESPGIEGEGGDAALWLVARKCASLRVPPELALLELLALYNYRCEPPWETKDLDRKLRSAWETSDVETDAGLALFSGLPGASSLPEHVDFSGVTVVQRLRERDRDPNHVYSFRAGEGKRLSVKELGSISKNELVSTFYLHPSWQGSLSWDARAKRVVCINPPIQMDCEEFGFTRQDTAALQCWIEGVLGVTAQPAAIQDAFEAAARRCSFFPVQDYLAELETYAPDVAMCIMHDLIRKWFGPQILPQEIQFVEKWLVAAVRRALHPGTKVQTVLVLIGKQGTGKSSFGQILFGEENFSDQMPGIEGRDASHALRGKWCVEFAELEVLLKDERATKAFLSRTTDKYRDYGVGSEVISPRQCVFLGTTNEDDFLRDPTGNRRIWPVYVHGKINFDALERGRDTIWSAAKSLASDKSYLHYYEDDTAHPEIEALQNQYLDDDEWQHAIWDYCAGREEPVRLVDVWEVAILRGDTERALKEFTRPVQLRLGRAMRRIGCTKHVVVTSSGQKKMWKMPEKIRLAAPSESELRRRGLDERKRVEATN